MKLLNPATSFNFQNSIIQHSKLTYSKFNHSKLKPSYNAIGMAVRVMVPV